MYTYLSKILPLFLMPLGLALLLLLVAFGLLHRKKLRSAAGVIILALAVLWTASTPFIADRLYRHMESFYPPVPIQSVPVRRCLVVLGGALGAVLPPRVEFDMNEAVDRIYKAAALYRAGKSPVVIVTGGNQPWSESKMSEADLMRDLLIEWGVPGEAILLEGSSQNTRENALYSKNIMDSISCEDALLVTSAAHMPRAAAAFRSVGLTVTPVSTDVRAPKQVIPILISFLPSADALAMTSSAIREWLGQKVYAWKGWN